MVVRKVWTDAPIKDAGLPRMRELFLRLLDRGLQGVPPAEGRDLVELFFWKAYGDYIPEDELSRAAFDLLIPWRAANAVIRVLYCNVVMRGAFSPGMKDFVDRISVSARGAGDADLAACAVYADRRDEFERRAGERDLSASNAIVLGVSNTRYRDAVLFLADAGRFREADYCSRIHRDFGLLALCAEKENRPGFAVGYYVSAGDLDSALRCAEQAGDQRDVARVYEKMGRIPMPWRSGRSWDAARTWNGCRRGRPCEEEGRGLNHEALRSDWRSFSAPAWNAAAAER